MIKHWTFSRYKDYSDCPRKYALRYVFGHQTPTHKAAERGTRIHNSIETYLLPDGKLTDLDHELRPIWVEQIKLLKLFKASPEELWEFDRDWYPATEDTVWLRMKIDAWYRDAPSRITVVDFKTGNPYIIANSDQVEVYAIAAFARFDDIDEVQTELWYLDADEPLERRYRREEAAKLARKWEQRSGRMLTDGAWSPKPDRKRCGWCPFSSNGLCPEGAQAAGKPSGGPSGPGGGKGRGGAAQAPPRARGAA